jgi:hypothetical protein
MARLSGKSDEDGPGMDDKRKQEREDTTMATQKMNFRCCNEACGRLTETTVEIPDDPQARTSGKMITIERYCQHQDCKMLNMLTVPEEWDFEPVVLGGDDDFIPTFQGQKPL